jgi:hypothetical protein
MMDGEVRTDEMVWGFGEGVDAKVCRMSPIYRSNIVSIVAFGAVQRTLENPPDMSPPSMEWHR